MELHHPADDGKADAVSLRGMGFIRLIELIEDLFLLLRRNGLSGVSDRDHDTIRLLFDLHRHGAPVRRKLYRIADQVDPDLLQQLLLRCDRMFSEFRLNLQLLLLQLIDEHEDTGADLLRQVEGGRLRQNGLAFNFGQAQHIGSHPGQPQRLGLDDIQIFRLLLGRQIAPLQQLGKARNGHDGRFELMGEVVDKVRSQQLRALQLFRHGIEAVGQLREGRDIPKGRPKFHPGLEIAGGQLVHPVDDPVDGLQRNPAGQHSHQKAHHQTDDSHQQRDLQHIFGAGNCRVIMAEPVEQKYHTHAHQQSHQNHTEYDQGKQQGQAEMPSFSPHFFTAL